LGWHLHFHFCPCLWYGCIPHTNNTCSLGLSKILPSPKITSKYFLKKAYFSVQETKQQGSLEEKPFPRPKEWGQRGQKGLPEAAFAPLRLNNLKSFPGKFGIYWGQNLTTAALITPTGCSAKMCHKNHRSFFSNSGSTNLPSWVERGQPVMFSSVTDIISKLSSDWTSLFCISRF